jgi:hypothetical protein
MALISYTTLLTISLPQAESDEDAEDFGDAIDAMDEDEVEAEETPDEEASSSKKRKVRVSHVFHAHFWDDALTIAMILHSARLPNPIRGNHAPRRAKPPSRMTTTSESIDHIISSTRPETGRLTCRWCFWLRLQQNLLKAAPRRVIMIL